MGRHSEEYVATLRSPRWHALRDEVIKSQGHVCDDCGQEGALELHHIHYETLGFEGPDDVVALCADCHPAADRRRAILTAAFRYA